MDGYECALGQGPAASSGVIEAMGGPSPELPHLCFLPEEAFVTKASSALKPRAAIILLSARAAGRLHPRGKPQSAQESQFAQPEGPAPVHDRRKRTPGRGLSRTQTLIDRLGIKMSILRILLEITVYSALLMALILLFETPFKKQFPLAAIPSYGSC